MTTSRARKSAAFTSTSSSSNNCPHFLPMLTTPNLQAWTKKQTLEQWISERVLKLTCTANDMIPLAKACNFNPNGDKAGGGIPQSEAPAYVWKWKEQERADLRAQLDAAYFHLYGLSRVDTAYILSTFQATGEPDNPHSTTSHLLAYYDQYSAA